MEHFHINRRTKNGTDGFSPRTTYRRFAPDGLWREFGGALRLITWHSSCFNVNEFAKHLVISKLCAHSVVTPSLLLFCYFIIGPLLC